MEGLQDVRVLNVHNTIYYIGNVVFNYKDASGNCLRGSSIEYGTFNIHDNSIHGEIVNSPKKICVKKIGHCLVVLIIRFFVFINGIH